MQEELFQPKGKTFYANAGFWLASILFFLFGLGGLCMFFGSIWLLLQQPEPDPIENHAKIFLCVFMLPVGAISAVYFWRLLLVNILPQRYLFLTIDRSGVSSNGFKPLDASNSMRECAYMSFAWTDIDKIGYTTTKSVTSYRSEPSYLIVFTKNGDIFALTLQLIFRWKNIEEEIVPFFPCTNFGNHDAFLAEYL